MPKVDQSDYKPYFDIEIDRRYKPADREAIAQEIIDFIANRTESGYDADGRKFVKYTKSYAKEKGQTDVDLTFSAEMLSEINLIQNKAGKIRIGYDRSYDGLGKVEGNILGTYGQSSPVNKGRNFLGISDKDLRDILSKYNTDEDTIISKEVSKSASRLAKNSRVEDFNDESE